jgi:hypothetical protein
MVLLVVILLTVAITLRSFDRANTARNVRVSQQVLAAATPALDRAKAKIQFMLYEDPQRPTATPSDAELYRIMSSYDPTNGDFYTFGDEKRLILRADLDGTGLNLDDPKLGLLIDSPARENEALNTAWRYPVDTNNDGKFDSFTLYGIYFRTPKTVQRSRKPLDARTPPMDPGDLNPACSQGQGTVASLVGDSGWERKSGRLQKSFFVYTVNVPITDQDIIANGLPPSEYLAFKGTSSISALEYQQDQRRIPLSNNAVVYEDDLDISPGPPLNLNGRILTNSNLLVSALGGARQIRLFQVSSQTSCFYDRENSQIVVAGNVVNGTASSGVRNAVEVHLFKEIADGQPSAGTRVIDDTNQSVTQNSFQVMYNNEAYSARLNAVVAAQKAAVPDPGANDPVEVIQAQAAPKSQTRDQALQDYFKERLRKVPFAEVPPGTPNGGVTPADAPYIIQDNGVNSLRPIEKWSLPTTTVTVGSEVKGTLSGAGRAELDIPPNQLESRSPDLQLPGESEENLGERVVVGNNLPQKRWDTSKNQFVSDEQSVQGATWTDGSERTRTPQVTKLADVGATDRGNGTGEVPPATIPPYRDGFWEKAAAEIPRTFLDGVGGLRVITSAGVYDRTNSFLPPPRWIDPVGGTLKSGPASIAINPTADNTYDDPATNATTEQYPVVWPDSMPMSPLGPGSQVYDNAVGGWTPWPGAATADGTGLPQAVASPVGETPTNAFKFAKGDLRMRATAVYHYAQDGYNPTTLAAAPAGTQPQQTPVACISSYYDPSNAFTARNIVGLTDISGEGAIAPTRGAQQAVIGSNNGIVYGPPDKQEPGVSNPPNASGLLTGGDPILEAQANMVFPDGRFANGPLRTALQVAPNARTLAQKAAIDSTKCALEILGGSIARGGQLIPIPDGAIQEVAFLNGREVKALDRDFLATNVNEAFTLSSSLSLPGQAATLTGNYNQPLEERQPLEIRATQLDLSALRQQATTGGNAPAGDWLLPNSGIIYASRDDALPDRSNRTLNNTGVLDESRSKTVSPTDNRLDPTRKPNGIVLINGDQLFRGGAAPTPPNSINDIVREKGLTLVSNLPAYIKGNFNLHGTIPPPAAGAQPNPNPVPVEEFNALVTTPGWGNFYDRTSDNNGLNPNFACRGGDPRLPNCQNGDFWRQANVLTDSLTLLSSNYRFGFRNEGDYDLRNNAGAAAVWPRRQQGFFNNNFVTNGLSSGAFLAANGNVATVVGGTRLTDATYTAAFPAGGLFTSSYFNNFVTPVQRRGNFPAYVMETCTKLPVAACTDADWVVNPLALPADRRTATAAPANYVTPTVATDTFQAGSTADPPLAALQRFPRRVAFSRTTSPQLDTPPNPQPLGIAAGGGIAPGVGDPQPNSLWFAEGGVGAVNFNAAAPHAVPYVVNNPTATAVSNVDPPDTIDGAKVDVPRLGPTSLPLNSEIGPTPSPPAAPIPLTPTPPFNGSQPLLLPVPQIQTISAPDSTGITMPRGATGGIARNTAWISQAVNNTFNVLIGAGDTPSRALNATTGDFNGGLQNLPRFLESWDNGRFATNIRGSFIQQGRSAFSTAPYQPILPPAYQPLPAGSTLASLFQLQRPVGTPLASNLTITNTYNTDVGNQLIPYFSPPLRNWGFDVGLLSQPPDLFTQRFTTPSTKTQPAEYFREVPRNDEWVTILMCGVVAPDQNPGAGQNATATRPSNCPT